MTLIIPFLSFLSVVIASDVLEFSDSNFDSQVRDHDLILVEFYAPWCGHCKRLAPEYERAATTLKHDDNPVSLAKVDCTAEKATCDKFGVSGFPTLKIFRNGEFSQEYDGPREADGIVKYMRSQSGPSSMELASIEAVTKFIDNTEHSILGFFTGESKLKDIFTKVADSLRLDYRFGYSTSPDVLGHFSFDDDIVIFRPPKLQNKFEDSQAKYDGDAVQHKIISFIDKNLYGLAGVRTTGNQNQFKKPLIVVYYDVDYIKNPKGSNYWRNRVMKVATYFTDKDVKFAVSNKDDFMNELTEYGLDSVSGDKPRVAGRNSKNEKIVMQDDFTVDNFEKFVNDFLNNNVEPYLKSEPIPEKQDGPVKIVVAKNFNEIVNDNTKDVLIEFYAPWCGHCKKLAPIYDELGEKLKDEDDIVIAKMDATANDVPSPYNVRGFPTLYFASKNNKDSPKTYEGERELKDFIKYLAKESTDPLKEYDRSGKKHKTEL